MPAPKLTPHALGFGPSDSHIVMNAGQSTAKIFDRQGNLLRELPCLARGVGGHYDKARGDTPPGLYYLGQIWNDHGLVGDFPAYSKELRSYGWITFDMVECENQENRRGRAGICLHGGGSACGWPGAWAAKQELHDTFGCLRMHNWDLKEYILPLTQKGKVWVSVHQYY